jgi:5-methyltetrahydropteroyltriglutamate--homocysteine methyltransferase
LTRQVPFRADQVGSLLRTQALKEARAAFKADSIDADALRATEDREIAALVRRQQDIGLDVATDGEFRRTFWHYDFFDRMPGIEGRTDGAGIQFQGGQTIAWHMHVVGRIGFDAGHPMLDHFRYLKRIATAEPKMTIPSPSMLYYRGGREMMEHAPYQRDLGAYYADMGAAYAAAVDAFAGAGCRYLQLDDVSFAYLCDSAQRKMLTDRGDDPDAQLEANIAMINAGVKDRPKDMVVTMHLCRGNFRSTFIASGGYEPVADALFNRIDVDGYFMEWDNDRSGGFEPLRFLPKGKTVVLGLVTTKTGAVERKDELKRRIDEAAKHAPLEQLCLSPQCGFASTEDGNALAEDDQWRKLALVVETAREVWG